MLLYFCTKVSYPGIVFLCFSLDEYITKMIKDKLIRKLLFLTGITLHLVCFSLQAQDSTLALSETRNIRDLYDYVKYKIERNQYYLNEFKINSDDLLWSDGKPYQYLLQFFYSFAGDNSPLLRLATVVKKDGPINYYYEFLYDNKGELAYVFEKQNQADSFPYRELRAYYANAICINLYQGEEIIDLESTDFPKIRELMEDGQYYARRFQKDMQEVNLGY